MSGHGHVRVEALLFFDASAGTAEGFDLEVEQPLGLSGCCGPATVEVQWASRQ